MTVEETASTMIGNSVQRGGLTPECKKFYEGKFGIGFLDKKVGPSEEYFEKLLELSIDLLKDSTIEGINFTSFKDLSSWRKFKQHVEEVEP